ncbi:MAG: toll/interleukin-1 receptor domain-containing protein [Microthrixaceae bacterium]
MSRVFLSHNHKDKPFVRRLATDLVQANLHVWIDEVEMAVGDSLIERIQDGIDSSDFLAVVLSHNSVASAWVREELHMALTDQINGKRIRVLPLKVDDCALPGFLRHRVYCDFTNSEQYREAFQQLVRDLGGEYFIDSSVDVEAHAWHCVYCGWRCQLSYNNYFCHACRAVRPRSPEGSATIKFCRSCGAGNIVIASFCESCGYRFGYKRV